MFEVKEDEFYAADITKVRFGDLPRADLWAFGFPCTDISISGRREGIHAERSGLFFSVTALIKRLPEKDKPYVLLIENVPNLLRVNEGFDFTEFLVELSAIGYDAIWQTLNSKNYGVPQNRERIFITGYLRSLPAPEVLLERRSNTSSLKQVRRGSQSDRIYAADGISATLTANGGGFGKGGLYLIDLNENPKITGEARCIQARYNAGVTKFKGEASGVIDLNTQRIRRLTPLECFRLQGFTDEQFYKAKKVNSNAQLYKQAGNAVTVNVAYVLGEKLKVYENRLRKENLL